MTSYYTDERIQDGVHPITAGMEQRAIEGSQTTAS